MKTYLSLLSAVWALVAAGCVGTQAASVEPSVPVAMVPASPPPPPPAEATAVTPSTAVAQAVPANAPQPGSVDELVAPIALYPDALVALILPASTASSDVVLAARYLNAGGEPNEIESRAWDESVKSLAHYPEVVKWMDENLAWTQRLGEAYLNQPEEVMAAIQRDRSRAQANGVLTNTPQQQVVADAGTIRIIPAQPDVIYVPRYDPEIIYVERPVYMSPDPWLTFGIGFGVGSWLAYDCDWHHRTIWIDPHHREHWRDRHDWRQPHFPGGSGGIAHDGWRRWTPPPGRRPPHLAGRDWPNRDGIRPRPMPGAPDFDHRRDRRPGDHAGTPNSRDAFRPGSRVPRPVTPSPERDGRPDRFAHRPEGGQGNRLPMPPAAGGDRSHEQRNWADVRARRDRPTMPGSRPVIAPPPAQPGNIAHTQPAGHAPRPDGSGRRFSPGVGEPRPGAPAPRPRPESAPIAQAGHRVPAVQAPPPAPAPRQAPAVAPAPVQSRPQFAPGGRVPHVERQDGDRGRARDRKD